MQKHSVTDAGSPLRPHVSITLDRPRRFVFDFNAVIELEQAAGVDTLNDPGAWMNLFGIVPNDEDPKKSVMKPNRKNLRFLVWAALLHENTDGWTKPITLTIEAAGVLLNTRKDEATIYGALLRAHALYRDAGTEDEKDRPTAAAGESPSRSAE